MTFPLYGLDFLGYEAGLVVFTLVGVAFGFVLERSGFGQAPVLAAQFYGTDTRVLKVMFTAIATALLGLTVLTAVGVLNFSLVEVPETFLWPHLVGGLLLGVGFVVAGYCPGTAVVGAASGNLDAVTTIVGVTAGSIVFGAAFPAVASFYESGAWGVRRVPEWLGVPEAVVAVAVSAMAVGAFFLAERLERRFSQRAGVEPPASSSRARNRVFALLGAAAALALGTTLITKPAPAQSERAVGTIGAAELAHRVIEAPQTLWLVDLRPSAQCQVNRIPTALCLPEDDAEGTFLSTLPSTRQLVLYAAEDIGPVPATAQAYRGEVAVLRGGYEAFAERFVAKPRLPANATAADVAEYRLRSSIHGWLTGAQLAAPPPPPANIQLDRPQKKGGGC